MKTHLASAFLACWTWFAANAADAPTTASRSSDANTNAFKLLSVTVLDRETGAPVAGAKVTAPHLVAATGTNDSSAIVDEQGKAVLRFPERFPNAQNFNLHCGHSNYAPRDVMFFSDAGDVMDMVPASYTFRLERGATIGGFVRDARGAPLRDVEVRVTGSGNTGVSPGGGERRSQEYSSVYPTDNKITTGANGLWTLSHFPPDLPWARVELVRPGGARSAFSTQAGPRGSGEDAPALALADLRATNAVLTLPDGVTIRGVVVNETGQPLAGARIRERSGRAAVPPYYTVTTDARGRFELPHRTARQTLLTVEAEGCAIKSEVVTISPGMSDVRIVLPPPQPLRLRVVGDHAQPAAGAEILHIEYRGAPHVLQWTGRTDVAGQLIWSNAPRDAMTLGIRTTNYPFRTVRVTAEGREHLVKLRAGSDKEVQVRISASDADSGARLERFEVGREMQWNHAFAEWGAATNGSFEGTIRASEFQRGIAVAYRLQVRAENCAPWTSDEIYLHEGDQDLSAKLAKGKSPAGIVLQPDGTPAADAKVMLNSGRDGSLFANRPGEFYLNRGAVMEKTGEDGRFKFTSANDESYVIVTHESGFASLPAAELKKSNEVKLQPWAGVEGQVRIAGAPVANERVSIKSPISWHGLRSYHLVFSTSTDADGNFAFTNLPPGDFVLYRMPFLIMGPTTESHRLPLDLKPGETKRVDYTFNGRTVTGRVEAGAAVDWKNDPHVLVLKTPPPPPEPSYQSYVDNAGYQKARDEYGKLPAVVAHARQQQQFQLVFDRDGNFRADDVVPGTYELRVRVTKPPKDRNTPRWAEREEALGTLTREVVVSAGPPEENFDLGTFELPMAGAGVTGTAVEFGAATLDGRGFELSSVRGQPVVVVFWAAWAPQSAESLASLRAVAEELAGRVAFVSVNLDEEADTARAALSELRRGWTHARLEGAARYNVTEQLGIDTLPTTLLLDSSGKVFARDVGTNRLRATVMKLAERK